MLSISAAWQVSTCGMSDAIGPVYVKERPGSELQSRIDAEVCFLYQGYLLVLEVEHLNISHDSFLQISGAQALARSL